VRRSVLLVLSVALAVLVFAPVAAAQSDDMGADDRGMDARGADDRGMDDRGFDDRGFDDRGMDDDATASPVSSASASTSATTSASASATTGSAIASASPTFSATPAPSSELPDTGGVSLVPMLSASVLALLVGSGIVATVLVRRAS
jgi:hypothetical protein